MKYFNQIKANIVKGEPRPAWTYRGARRNVDRLDAPSKQLREERRALRFTRRQFTAWQQENERKYWNAEWDRICADLDNAA